MPVLNNRIAYGIGGVCVVAIALVSGNVRNETHTEAAVQFAVTKAEEPIMAACEDAMRRNDLELMRGVDEFTACGCMTREVVDVTDEADYRAARSAMGLVIDMGGNANDEAFLLATLPRFQQQHGLTADQAGSVFTNVSMAMATCSDRETYMSEEERDLIRRNEENAERRMEKERLVSNRRVVAERRNARTARPDVPLTRETRGDTRRVIVRKPRDPADRNGRQPRSNTQPAREE